MQITITLTDKPDGSVEISEERLPHAGETAESATTAMALADVLRQKVEELGEVTEDVTACGITVVDDGDGWNEV